MRDSSLTLSFRVMSLAVRRIQHHKCALISTAKYLRDNTALREAWNPNPSFDSEKMNHFLDYENHDLHKRMRKFLSSEEFIPRYDIPLVDDRELALKRLKLICDNKFISVHYFSTNPTGTILSANYTTLPCDLYT